MAQASPKRWAKPTDVSDLVSTHRGLKIAQIMTVREKFFDCQIDERVDDVLVSTDKAFDFLPVRDDGRVVGLLHAIECRENDGSGLVREAMIPLHEGIVASAEKTILDFMVSALKDPCQFVVGEDGIEGLVTLSDLQRMPAQAALFTLAMGIEGRLADLLLRVIGADPSEALVHRAIDQGPRSKIESYIASDSYVSWPLALMFGQKIELAIQLGLPAVLADQLDEWRELRNALAHLDHYAATREDAMKRCRQVANADALIASLNAFKGEK